MPRSRFDYMSLLLSGLFSTISIFIDDCSASTSMRNWTYIITQID